MDRNTAKEQRKVCNACRRMELLEVPEVPAAHVWAIEKRMMPGSVTAKPGPYDLSLTPYMRDPMESYDDPEVQTTVLCMAKRMGKTEGELNIIGRTIDVDPCNILVVYPNIEDVKEYFVQSVQPMFDNASCFRGKISNPAKRDGSNTARSKKFPGGILKGIGANSPARFRGIQARIAFGCEIDSMEAGKEGDPIDLLFTRTENYPNAIQGLSSTPTTKGTSRIWEWLERSDFRKYYVLSPFSGKWITLEWRDVKWDQDKPDSAAYHDPDTGDKWTEKQRHDAILNGKWEATRPFTGIRGYHLNGLYSLFPPKKGFRSKPHQWATEFIAAKAGGPESVKVWVNTFLAECWEEEAEQMEWELVSQRAEDYEVEPLPERVLLLTLAADVQDNRIEYEWVGWGEDFESWGLQYGVVGGDTKRPEVWTAFEKVLRSRWKHPIGVEMGFDRCFVDEGFRPEMVRGFALRMLKQGMDVYPVQGIGRTGVIEPELITFKTNKQQKGIKAPTWNVGVTRAKRTIYNHMLQDPPGPNTMHFPKKGGYDDRFFQMLCAEKVTTKYSYGKPYKIFECPNGVRNEALDIRAYGYAAAVSLNPNWTGLHENLATRKRSVSVNQENEYLTEPQKESSEPEERRGTRRRTGGRSFVNDW